MKRRILYVESSRGSIGGSMHSLWTLVKSLNRERYEPVVLAFWQDDFWDRFRQSGVEVILWPEASTEKELLPRTERAGHVRARGTTAATRSS